MLFIVNTSIYLTPYAVYCLQMLLVSLYQMALKVIVIFVFHQCKKIKKSKYALLLSVCQEVYNSC